MPHANFEAKTADLQNEASMFRGGTSDIWP